MPKNLGGKGPVHSRVRFVLVEAEGDIGQVTQAIQNAFRSPAVAQPKRIGSAKANATSLPDNQQTEFDFEDEIEEVDDDEVVEARATQSKPRAPRKAPSAPDVVPLDMNSEVSLASFAQGKDTKSQHKKYLVAAAWLHEHRSIKAVTAGHIYTCFRSQSWPTNIQDFWQPLRELKARKFFTRNDQNEYEINHIGLDYVNKLGGSNGAG